jgi:hypothetical protein
MADLKQIGTMLAGFSAGSQGQLPAFIQTQQNQQVMDQQAMAQKQAEAERRMATYYTDAAAGLDLLKSGNIDGFLKLGSQRLQLLQNFPDADPSDTQRLMQLGVAAKNGSKQAAELLKAELETTVDLGRELGIIEMKGPQVVPGSSIVNGQIVTMGADGRPMAQAIGGFQPEQPEVNYNQPFLPDGSPNTAYQQYQQSLRAPSTTNITNMIPGAQNAYIQGRAGQQATTMGELEKSAEGAYRANAALDRFVQSSAKGDAGAAQPFITGTKSFLSSFGFSPESLVDTATMQQAIGDILGARMAELGARGLTDRDMDVLRQALPRVETSHDARVQIADILRKANQGTLKEYVYQANQEQQQYPDYQFRRPSWFQDAAAMTTPPEDDPLGLRGGTP